ncbi:MAG TPA: TfoX/Sxy family protein [Stellaceae bacterium]|nr:TfoX/Sxy family protein [Stellaceae bacterium]
MVASDGFAEFLRDQLAPLGRITLRRMFGKSGLFCDGLMLGMVTEDTLYFRVDELNRAAFKEAEAYPPLNYKKQGSTIDLAFWRAPERLLDEPDELIAWARKALEAATRVAAKRRSAPPRRQSAARPRPRQSPRAKT